MNGNANVTGGNYALTGKAATSKADASQKTAASTDNAAANGVAAPAYQVELSEEALWKERELIEQICKQQGIEIDTLDGPFSSLHAEEVDKRTDSIIKITTGEDLTRRNIERMMEKLLKKSDENGGIIESEDMFDSLIFRLNGYNGYEGDISFFDKVLEDLQKKDPERKSDFISKMKDLFEEAKSGYYMYTRSKTQERNQQIKGIEKAIEANNSQIEAMQEKLKKLNEKLMALQKEAISDEEKRSKTKPIEKQIESINEQLAKLYALQRELPEDLAEASSIRKLR